MQDGKKDKLSSKNQQFDTADFSKVAMEMRRQWQQCPQRAERKQKTDRRASRKYKTTIIVGCQNKQTEYIKGIFKQQY